VEGVRTSTRINNYSYILYICAYTICVSLLKSHCALASTQGQKTIAIIAVHAHARVTLTCHLYTIHLQTKEDYIGPLHASGLFFFPLLFDDNYSWTEKIVLDQEQLMV
jgi:hypothetical protein